MSNISLKAMLELVDQASAPLKKIMASSDKVSDALKKQRDELFKLKRTQSDISSFRILKNAVKTTRTELAVAKATVAQLGEAYAKTAKPTKKMTKEFEKAKSHLEGLKQKEKDQFAQLSVLRKHLTDAGISTKSLARDSRNLKIKTDEATAALEKEKKVLDKIVASQNRIKSIQTKTGLTGAGMVLAGATVLHQMKNPLNENKSMDIEENRIASLGLGKMMTKEAIDFAKAMKTFGTSTLENVQLMRDGVTAFADVHHAEWVAPTLAKMKFANETMYGNEQGHENERKFMDMLKVIEMRNGLKSQDAFKEQANIIQQVITATGGRVQGSEWLNAIKTGGLAVKGMSNEAFYYKLEPLVQEMGGHRVGTALMSAYQNLYQGKTDKRSANRLLDLGLISDPSKLKHDKAGQISFLDVGAIKGADLFKKDQFAWMEQVLLPALAKKGITKEKDILDAMGGILSNRTASNIFSQMYLQRDQIHKNAKLNAGADGIDALNSKAENTTAGKEIALRAKLHDFYLEFGKTILPAYTKGVELASKALSGLNHFMQANPKLAKMIGTGLLVIGVGLVAIGALVAVFAPLLLGMLSLRFAMATMAGTGLKLGSVFRFLISPFSGIANGIKWLGSAFLNVGSQIIPFLIRQFGILRAVLLTNPIVALISVIAFLIYKYWGPIKAFFVGFWDGLKEGLEPLFNTLKEKLAPLQPLWDGLVEVCKIFVGVLGEIFTPFQATNEEMTQATSAGQAFGYAIGTVVSIIGEVIIGIVDFLSNISNMGSAIFNFFADIKNGSMDLGQSFITFLQTPLQSVIDTVNLLISALNLIPSINIPKLPDAKVLTQSVLNTNLKTTTAQPIKPLMMKQAGNQTNYFAPAQIHITGVTDPKAAGTAVGKEMKLWQQQTASKQNRNYADHE